MVCNGPLNHPSIQGDLASSSNATRGGRVNCRGPLRQDDLSDTGNIRRAEAEVEYLQEFPLQGGGRRGILIFSCEQTCALGKGIVHDRPHLDSFIGQDSFD